MKLKHLKIICIILLVAMSAIMLLACTPDDTDEQDEPMLDTYKTYYPLTKSTLDIEDKSIYFSSDFNPIFPDWIPYKGNSWCNVGYNYELYRYLFTLKSSVKESTDNEKKYDYYDLEVYYPPLVGMNVVEEYGLTEEDLLGFNSQLSWVANKTDIVQLDIVNDGEMTMEELANKNYQFLGAVARFNAYSTAVKNELNDYNYYTIDISLNDDFIKTITIEETEVSLYLDNWNNDKIGEEEQGILKKVYGADFEYILPIDVKAEFTYNGIHYKMEKGLFTLLINDLEAWCNDTNSQDYLKTKEIATKVGSYFITKWFES